MAAVNMNDLDDLEEGPFETSARVNVMMNLLLIPRTRYSDI